MSEASQESMPELTRAEIWQQFMDRETLRNGERGRRMRCLELAAEGSCESPQKNVAAATLYYEFVMAASVPAISQDRESSAGKTGTEPAAS